MRRHLFLTIVTLLAAAQAAMAVPACPDPATVSQPDGTSLTLCLLGDEFRHFNTTSDGYSVVKNGEGYYVYAQLEDGCLTATEVIAHDPEARAADELAYLATVEKYLTPDITAQQSEAISAQRTLTKEARTKLHNYGLYDTSNFRGLVILVEYNDCSFTRDDIDSVFTDMINQKDYEGVPSTDGTSIVAYTGSVRDYYYENSDGAFDPTFDVVGPVTVNYSQYYANSTSNGSKLAKAACQAADDLVNFADYDRDGDGTVDMVYFIYAGCGSHYTGNDERLIWPHASSMSNLTLDGVKLSRYACSVEIYGSGTTIDGIGTICHEFSHVLGLDDLYDTDYSSSGGQSVHPGKWSVMAQGSYLNYSRTPAGYSLYERYALGFVEPTVIEATGQYTLRALGDYNEGYRINAAIDNEFFMLENRQKSGWDAYLPGEGMLVFRVDSTDTDVWEDNDVNVNPDHNYYELLRAYPSQASISGSAYDPFPGTGNVTKLTNETDPSIASWTGVATPYIVKNISESSGVISFNVLSDAEMLTENFESMPLIDSDTTFVQGTFASWDFCGAKVIEAASSAGNGSQTAALYYDGYIATSTSLAAEKLTSVTFSTWNTSFKDATVHLYLSTDGGSTWTEYFEEDCTEATTVSSRTFDVEHVYPMSLTDVTFKLKVLVDGKIGSGYCLVDDLIVGYNGTITTQLNGSGTADDPYLISTTVEWNTIAEMIASNADDLTGKYVKLVANIDFEGAEITPFGYDGVTSFNGDLDGNGKTISNFMNEATGQYYGPIVMTTGSDACLHDLTVDGTLTSEYIYTGGVVGQLGGKMTNVTSSVSVTGQANCTAGMVGSTLKNSQMSGCVNTGSVTSSGFYTSGLVGYGGKGTTYTDCGNTGTVTYTGTSTTSYSAGLVGYGYYGTFTRCYNSGTVTATNSNAGGMAGIIAMAGSSVNDTVSFRFEQCYNTADISSSFSNAGILFTGGTATTVVMDGCYNTGDITSTFTSSKSGAYTAGVAACYFPGSTYSGCWNSGAVTSYKPGYAAGVLGGCRSEATSEAPTSVTACFNTGQIYTTGDYAAGVAAYVGDFVTVDSCYNTGAVSTESSYAGGVVATLPGDSAAVTRCWNAGAVTAASGYAGGILGAGEASSAQVSDCYNVGDVTASGERAGGIAGSASGALAGVYNTAAVTGTELVGGVVGGTTAGTTAISGAYSTGTVSATGTCGNIVGVSTSDGSYWTSGNTLSDTYYLDVNDAGGTDSYSQGLTYAQLGKIELDGWNNGDDYTYPVIADNCGDYALAHAAAVVPCGGDTYSDITGGFRVGAPDGVTWSPTRSAVSVSGNVVSFTAAYSGELYMWAVCGSVKVATVLTCNVTEPGVDGVDALGDDGKEVISETYYNTSGARVAEPAAGQKAIYIVVRRYSDGTASVTKQAR